MSLNDAWFEDMTEQLQKKKGLTKPQAQKAAEIFRSEWNGQNAHALWQYAIQEAKKD